MILPDWMAGFYTLLLEKKNAPPLFAKWAAAFVIGAAVQRKVWSFSLGEKIYPNLYVFLCGPSGTGKGNVIVPSHRLLSQMPGHFIAPASITTAALVDEFLDFEVAFVTKDGTGYQYNAVTVLSRELAVFLPAYETSTHAFLTDVFDGQGYDERRRHGPHKGRVEIPNAHLALMAGTTPEYLSNMLPDGAWSEGFMSRVILAYSGAQPVTPLFEQFEDADNSLCADA